MNPFRCLTGLLFAASAHAQLIPAGSPLPRTAPAPVVFVNGYQNSCGTNQFAANFGKFDQFLQAAGRVTVLFDNCLYPNEPPIEELGNHLRDFLAALQYADGARHPGRHRRSQHGRPRGPQLSRR